jgi:hypothetical protein
VMVPRGNDFVCERCHHIVAPERPEYHCPCRKCWKLNRPLESARG